MEEWKTIIIDGEEWNYEVSSLGRVRNKKTGRLMKQGTNKGYLQVGLSKNAKKKAFQVHRLVAIMFIPNPNNLPQVDHIDENPLNNNVDNLRWVTAKENVEHSQKGGKNYGAKKVRCIETGQVFDCIVDAERCIGIRGGIMTCLVGRGKTAGGYHWEYVEEEHD